MVTPQVRDPASQTRETLKDLSEREREDRVCGVCVGSYTLYMCHRGGGGRGEYGFRSGISGVIHTYVLHT